MSDRGYFDAERDRRISNVVREGVISEIQGATARVTLTEDLETDFLPVRQVHAGRIRSWSPLKVGEQVSVLSASGETGAGTILRGLNCNTFPAPSTDPDVAILAAGDDGMIDQYDLAQHIRTISIPAGGQLVIKVGESTALVIADGSITLQAAEIVTDGVTRLNKGVRAVVYRGSEDSAGDINTEGADDVYV